MRQAGTDDLPRLQDIEVAAGETFRMIGMEAIADDAPPSLDALATYQLDGRAWVATDSNDQPIAYILVQIADRDAHIDQITVHPKHARQGIGRELIDEAASWATARDLEEENVVEGSGRRSVSRWPTRALFTRISPVILKVHRRQWDALSGLRNHERFSCR